MTLLQEVNNTVKSHEQEVSIINNNINLLSENIEESSEFITEAITNWLAKVNKVVGGGRLDPEKQKSVSEILGAVSALGNPDTAAAFNEKGDLGTVLFMASSKNPQESNAALKRLREIGRHESARTYTSQAQQAMNDPSAFTEFVNKAKVAIDRVMRSNLAKEKSATQDPITNNPAETGTAPAANQAAAA
jgi:hypothetical protein